MLAEGFNGFGLVSEKEDIDPWVEFGVVPQEALEVVAFALASSVVVDPDRVVFVDPLS